MEGKFLGVGLINLVGIGLFTILFIVGVKLIFNTYQIDGVTEVVNSV